MGGILAATDGSVIELEKAVIMGGGIAYRQGEGINRAVRLFYETNRVI